MKKSTTNSYRHQRWRAMFRQQCERLFRATQTGKLAHWTAEKRQQAYEKLDKLAQRLGVPVKPALMAGLLSSGVLVNKATATPTMPEDAFHPDAAFRQLQKAYLERAYLHYDQADLDPFSNLHFPFNRSWEVPLYTLNSPSILPLATVTPIAVESTAMKVINMDGSSDFGANYGIYGGAPAYRLTNPTDPTGPPAAPTQPDLAAESDTGKSDDNVTTNLLPIIQGQAPHNTTIQLESNLDGVLATNIVVDDNGNWQVRLSQALSEGEHQIIAKSSNEEGTSPASAPLALFTGAGDKQGNGTNNVVIKSDGTATQNSVVGGGDNNKASADYATVGGGDYNIATALNATVGGGRENQATGNFATIPGGRNLNAESYGETAIGFHNTVLTVEVSATNPNKTTAVPTDRLFVIGNGTFSAKSDALVMLKNGNTTLNGGLTLSLPDGSDKFTLPNTDGMANQVLQTDGNGVVTWATVSGGGSSGAFATTGNVTSNSPGTLKEDDFVFGSDQLDDADDSDKDARMFFDKSKAAFRAGIVTGDEWNDENVGINSTVAGGKNNQATGFDATVGGGHYNQATGDYATVGGGYSNQATGSKATVGGGYKSQASGSFAIVGGGDSNQATANFAIVVGGKVNRATGYYATVGGGGFNKATGNYATIPGGKSLNAESYGETAIGFHNTLLTVEAAATNPNKTTAVPTDRLFVIGNGTFSAKSDALVMLKNGNTTLNGGLTLSLPDGSDKFTLPNTDGTANQVLQTDGNGVVTWATVSGGGSSGAFATTGNVTSNSPGTLKEDDFVFGSDQLDDADDSDKDARMFFDKSKAAFRAGIVTGDEWNDEKVGSYSTVAGGKNNQANDRSATVGGGEGNQATSNYATVGGGLKTMPPPPMPPLGGAEVTKPLPTSPPLEGELKTKPPASAPPLEGGDKTMPPLN